MIAVLWFIGFTLIFSNLRPFNPSAHKTWTKQKNSSVVTSKHARFFFCWNSAYKKDGVVIIGTFCQLRSSPFFFLRRPIVSPLSIAISGAHRLQLIKFQGATRQRPCGMMGCSLTREFVCIVSLSSFVWELSGNRLSVCLADGMDAHLIYNYVKLFQRLLQNRNGIIRCQI